MVQKVTFKEADDIIANACRVNFYTHAGPDGDSIASSLAYAMNVIERVSGIDAQVIVLDPLAGKLAHFPFPRHLIRNEDRAADLSVYLDTAHANIATAPIKEDVVSVDIDHHAQRSPFADFDYAREHPSCAGLIFREWTKLKIPVSTDVAAILLIGVVSDTANGLFGDYRARSCARADINALDRICNKANSSYINSFMGLEMEQEKWLISLESNVRDENEIVTLDVPIEKLVGLSYADRRMRLQEVPVHFSGKHHMWSYQSPNDGKRYSLRSNDFNTLDFIKENKYDGGGHKAMSNFTTTEPFVVVDQKFRDYIKNRT